METQQIQSLVDRLLARDQVYRPLALLRMTLRLGPEDQRRWERGELTVLEDGLAGNPEYIIDMLRAAAAWAERLGLRAEVESSPGGRVFHNGNDHRLACTVWHRPAPSPQGDLFLDSGLASARHALSRALLAADAAGAEHNLADMARAQPGHEVQADAEHLVGALGWLGRSVSDPAGFLENMEEELHARAVRFLGPRDAEQFLQPFREHLMAALDAAEFDPDRPQLHPSALAERMGDWEGVIDATEAVSDVARYSVLLERRARAGLAAGRREIGLAALCQLCWRHPERAEAFLESCGDEEIARRLERFWDLEPLIPIGLFPAWLTAGGYRLPEIDPDACPDSTEVQALQVTRRLLAEPGDTGSRQWLQLHAGPLFEAWLQRRA